MLARSHERGFGERELGFFVGGPVLTLFAWWAAAAPILHPASGWSWSHPAGVWALLVAGTLLLPAGAVVAQELHSGYVFSGFLVAAAIHTAARLAPASTWPRLCVPLAAGLAVAGALKLLRGRSPR
jgi:hypothetical protein